MAEAWRKGVHVRSGKTRDSIHAEGLPNGDAKATGSHGAVPEEFGTQFRPPHPSARPAIETTKRRMRGRKPKV